jgi:hypothetical protein
LFILLIIIISFYYYSLVIIENDLPNETIEHLNFVPVPSNASPAALTPPTAHHNKSIIDVLDENSPTTEYIRSSSTHTSISTEQQNEKMISGDNQDVSPTTNISSSIGPATSTPSPSSARHYKPISLSSTQSYFKTIQQQRASSPNIQHVQTIIHDDDDDLPRPRTSSLRHGEKKDTVATVRFVDANANAKKNEETYL